MPSSKKCRSQFTAYLRNNKITYSIWPGHVDVNNFRFHFLEQSERILIRCGLDVPYSYSIPYCCPDTLIKKALNFHQCIVKKYPGKTFLIPEKKLSRVKRDAGKKSMLKPSKEPVTGLIRCE